MSYWRETWVAGLATLVAAGSTCLAQTNLTPSLRTTERDGRIVVSEQQATELGLINIGVGSAGADRQNLTPAVKERLQRFELSRDAYLREQDQLKKRLNGATTEAERERVRALIKDRRNAWLRQSLEMRTQAKDRIAELRRQMPSRAEIIKDAEDKARDTVNEIRKRRAIDP